MIILCPKCTTRLKVPDSALGKTARCPKCAAPIQVPGAPERPLPTALASSSWHYIREGWFSDEEVGPINDAEFLRLVRAKKISAATGIRSPELTANQWTNLAHVDLGLIEQHVRAREGELRRQEEERLHRQRIDQANREKLRAMVRQAVADGDLTKDESNSLFAFATQIGVPQAEVSHILKVEGQAIVTSVLSEILHDGIVSPDEEIRLAAVTSKLGIPYALDEATAERMELAKLCWLFNNCETSEFPTIDPHFKLQGSERCFGRLPVEWNEVAVTISRTSGQQVKLVPFAVGDVYVTDKRLVFVAALGSKTLRHASITRVARHTDGVLFGRSTGKSIFLRFAADCAANQRLALLMERICLHAARQLTAFPPESAFLTTIATREIPPIVDAEAVNENQIQRQGEPRYTFRVVGEHIGGRRELILRLRAGDQLFLKREPTNPVDENAVIVLNGAGGTLGYLKREVAEWFATKLDAGEAYYSVVHRVDRSGYLVVGLYQY